MRMSKSFGTTLREAPGGSDAISHQLLVRAGYIRQVGQGLFAYLPLARRAMNKIEAIIRAEMNAIGGQELTMPVVHPAEIWKQTGRWASVGAEMARFKDRRDRDMVLAMTHEEIATFLAASEIRSYRQLPQLVYHLQTKFRDDPRPRAGLIRVREFTMKDSYSLDADEAGLDRQYRAHYRAYGNIFARCGLPVISVASDVGMMGGSLAHEFMVLTSVGEDTLVLCDACGYAANRQVATYAKAPATIAAPRVMTIVATPAARTIDALAELLGIGPQHTAKAVFMMAGNEGRPADDRFIFAVVRGDMELNETKLVNAISADWLRPATEDEIRRAGAVPGYASPIGLRPAIGAPPTVVAVDESVPQSPNLVAGANEDGYHLLNTNVPRDYVADVVADLAAARDGDACARCGAPLRTSRGVEVGNIFKLGTRYSSALGAAFVDASGAEKPIVMGSYGIGVGRLLACVAEMHHDANGLRWPVSIAPYGVHLVGLGGRDASALSAADQAYLQMTGAGLEVLFDDRDETPGVKFADADLLGMPVRVTVSPRSIKAGGAEVRLRSGGAVEILALDGLAHHVSAELAELRARLDGTVEPRELS